MGISGIIEVLGTAGASGAFASSAADLSKSAGVQLGFAVSVGVEGAFEGEVTAGVAGAALGVGAVSGVAAGVGAAELTGFTTGGM